MRLFISFVLLCAITQLAFAQDGVPALGSTVLEIDGKIGAIVSFESSQVATSSTSERKDNGRHQITVVAKLGSMLDLMAGLTKRMKGEVSSSASTVRLLIMSTTAPGVVGSIREFTGVTVASFTFADFEAGSTEPLQITLRFRANELVSSNGNGRTVSFATGSTRQISKGSFRFELGALPTRSISKISSLALHPIVTIDAGAMAHFDLWIPLASATPWSQWTAQQQASGSALPGVVSILTVGSSTVIATLTINGIRPVQYSESSGPSGSFGRVLLSAGTSTLAVSR